MKLSCKQENMMLKYLKTTILYLILSTFLLINLSCESDEATLFQSDDAYTYTIVEIYDPICKLVQFGIIVN